MKYSVDAHFHNVNRTGPLHYLLLMWLCACLELLGEENVECLTYGVAMDLCAIAIVHIAAELQQQPMTCCVNIWALSSSIFRLPFCAHG